MNKAPSSSEELDSDADIGSDMSDDVNDNDAYDAESRTADDTNMIDDDAAPDDEAPIEVL